jgi:hypothetical protein
VKIIAINVRTLTTVSVTVKIAEMDRWSCSLICRTKIGTIVAARMPPRINS